MGGQNVSCDEGGGKHYRVRPPKPVLEASEIGRKMTKSVRSCGLPISSVDTRCIHPLKTKGNWPDMIIFGLLPGQQDPSRAQGSYWNILVLNCCHYLLGAPPFYRKAALT